MNNKLVLIVAIILAFSLAVNGYLYATLVQTQNSSSTQISALENERDFLKAEVSTLVTERDAARVQVASLSSERDALQNERDYMIGEVTALTSERDTLKGQVSSLVTERDEALTEVEAYVGLNNALNTEVNELKDERDLAQSLGSLLWEQREKALANVDSLKNQIVDLQNIIDTLTANIP
jgi:uncharacterized coiled-coil DUF342 family protein